MSEEVVAMRPLTPLEQKRAIWLNRIRLPAGPRDLIRRLARDVGVGEISEDEAYRLARTAWRFRGRIPADLRPLSEPQRHRRFGGDD